MRVGTVVITETGLGQGTAVESESTDGLSAYNLSMEEAYTLDPWQAYNLDMVPKMMVGSVSISETGLGTVGATE